MKRRSLIFYSALVVAIAACLILLPLATQAVAQRSPSNSPPLRGLMQEYEPVIMPEATAYSVFTTSPDSSHQVWYRISGGDALFRQRLRVLVENAAPRPQNQLPPDSAVRQELTSNTPTSWFVLPSARGVFTYYFDGDHRIRPGAPWANGLGIKVQRSRFANGNLFKLGFEDQVSLDDYNDLEVQVAILRPS